MSAVSCYRVRLLAKPRSLCAWRWAQRAGGSFANCSRKACCSHGLGGVCGVLLAQWGVSVLVGLVAREAPLDTRPDTGVLVFTAGVSIIAGLLFGLIPAVQASRTNLVVRDEREEPDEERPYAS